MLVLCTGPESSGTRLLSRIVATGTAVVHRSIPHGQTWWTLDDWRGPIVAIVREEFATCESALAAGHAATLDEAVERRQKAIQILQAREDVIWVQYERLVADPVGVTAEIGRALGVELTVPEPITDENRKYER